MTCPNSQHIMPLRCVLIACIIKGIYSAVADFRPGVPVSDRHQQQQQHQPGLDMDRMSLIEQSSRLAESHMMKSHAEFRRNSEQQFKMLQKQDYQDPSLMNPQEKRDRHRAEQAMTNLHNQHKQQQQQRANRVGGRRRAYQIATKDLLFDYKCEGTRMKQRIRVNGCDTKVFINKFCHGTCRSFFIPRLSTSKLVAAFESCSACLPDEYHPVVVTLNCPALREKQLQKTIIRVKSCTCRAVNRQDLGN